MLTLLDALIFANKGTVLAFGKELTEKTMRDPLVQREFRGRVGFVFQNPDVQLFCPTVREDIVFGPLQQIKKTAPGDPGRFDCKPHSRKKITLQ